MSKEVIRLVSVFIKYGNVDSALRAFKKQQQKEGRTRFMKRRFFESKGQKIRRKTKQSTMRRYKLSRRDNYF